MKNTLKRISVVGLGRLGLPLAVCFARKGFQTIGLDIDSAKIQALNKGIISLYEPRLKTEFETARGRLTLSDDYEKTILNSDVTFILVPTPSDNQNSFSLEYVLKSAEAIGSVIARKSGYHLIVLTSTVMPGATEKRLKPALETCSGKRCGIDFGLCYNPEFIALGSVIHDLLNPDFILIGESGPQEGSMLADLYRSFCENSPSIARMNFINAELTKLALNTYVTTKISFANTLARICECLPGADVNIVTSALGLDSRIGNKYLKGSVGYGGPCFPRDNLALSVLARSLGVTADLAEATHIVNKQQIPLLVKVIKKYLTTGKKIGILGLSYKPNSDVVEESQGLLLAQALTDENFEIIVFDPAAMSNAKHLLKRSALFATSARECISKADIVVITTPWEEFKQFSQKEFARTEPARVVIDCWRILKDLAQSENIVYVPLGIGGLRRTLQI